MPVEPEQQHIHRQRNQGQRMLADGKQLMIVQVVRQSVGGNLIMRRSGYDACR
jgi:hypothetical protein